MRRPENIAELGTLAPDYMGMIFWSGSSRFVTKAVPPKDEPFQRVGVFVNASLSEIASAITLHHLDLLQLHGDETPAFCSAAQQLRPVIKAFAVGADFDFTPLKAYENCCDFFLFDTRGPLPGGNGSTFDWTLLETYPFQKPFFLSGGIGPESISALKKIQSTSLPLHAIDVNSKFETAPGIKDVAQLQHFKKECNAL